MQFFLIFFDIAVKRAIFVVMEEDLKTAVEVMRKGGVILYPTDTIWGIGCDATNAEAVDKVYKIKKRANNKAMLVLVGKMEDVENYVETVPEMAYQLNELSEKPITIIYDNALNLAQELLGEGADQQHGQGGEDDEGDDLGPEAQAKLADDQRPQGAQREPDGREPHGDCLSDPEQDQDDQPDDGFHRWLLSGSRDRSAFGKVDQGCSAQCGVLRSLSRPCVPPVWLWHYHTTSGWNFLH
jgi:hypothetical protein